MDAPQQDLRLKIRLNDQFSDAEKNQLLELLNARKKYGLVWEDKPEEVEQIMQQQLPVFVEVPDLYIEAKTESLPNVPQLSLDLTEADTQNANAFALQKQPPPHHLLIEGDNLHALTALAFAMPEKVDVIYIDPPYNTGNKDFIYNDSFVDREDGYRHSKWLSFMAKRLHIAKKLLKESGVIFISIDDNEQAQLKMLCDEVFGEENFVANVIWQKKFSPQNDAKFFSDNHDFIICYAKNRLGFKINPLERSEKAIERYKNVDNDQRGVWTSGDCSVKTYSASYDYPIITPSGRIVNPPSGYCWRFSKEKFAALVDDKRIWFGVNGDNVPRFKRFLSDVKEGVTPMTIWLHEEVGHNQSAKQEMKSVLHDTNSVFDTPKPTKLIERILQLSTNKSTPSVILDFFAGSGTTLHAVMQLNAEDGGNRQCLLVTNNENNIARDVCYERNKRVIAGYTKPNGTAVKGLTNNHLHYFKVDFAERSSSLTAKLDLVRKATDLLRLKENCWETVVYTEGGEDLRNLKDFVNLAHLALYKNATHYLLMIYDDRYLSEAVDLIGNLHPLSDSVTKEYVLTYVFSDSPHDHREEFEGVLSKMRLCALPEAIYNALRDLLPRT